MTYTNFDQFLTNIVTHIAVLEGVTLPVLIILGALWAAVLLPPLLRARADKKSGAIGDYTHSIGVLKSNRGTARTRSAAALVDGKMHSGQMSKSAAIQKRRRDVLIGLLGAAGITFLLAVVVGNSVFWMLHLLCDIALGAYIYLLIQIKEQQRLRKESSMDQNNR